VTSRELGQPVDVVAGTALLATGEMAFADGAGKSGVALRAAGENDQVGPGRVGDTSTRWRRDGRGTGRILAAAGKGELGAEDGGTPTSFAASAKRTTP